MDSQASGDASPRPTSRRRVDEESDADDDMLGNGNSRFRNRGSQEEDEDAAPLGPLPAYELHRVQPDPFDSECEMFVISGLESARQLMASFSLLFDPQHYGGEGYAGMIAKVFHLPVSETQPDMQHILDAVLHMLHERSPAETADHIKMLAWHVDTMITGIRAMFMPNKTHPQIEEMYEQNMQLLDSMNMMTSMHKLTLLSIVAQSAGDLQIMADATILLKPFEEMKDQVKLQKHLFRLFEEQQNRVFADKVSLEQYSRVLLLSPAFHLCLLSHSCAGAASGDATGDSACRR